MSDYYSYKPLVRLERPVALVGFPGCRPMQTGRVAAMITGLQVVMIPRQAMHKIGRHPEALLREGLAAKVHEVERELINRALASRSPHILALGPTTLMDPMLRSLVAQRCTVVYLEQSLEHAVDALLAEMKDDVRKHRHLDAFIPLTPETLRPIFEERDAVFRGVADRVISIDGRAPLAVGRSLPDALGWS